VGPHPDHSAGNIQHYYIRVKLWCGLQQFVAIKNLSDNFIVRLEKCSKGFYQQSMVID